MKMLSSSSSLSWDCSPGCDDHVIKRHVVEFYAKTLQLCQEPQEYLRRRQISGEAVDYFKIGYSNRTLGLILPQKNRKAGAALRGQLQRLGIIRSNGREHFRGSIVIPIINDQVVKTIYGKKLSAKLRPGTPKHLYVPENAPGIFNLEAINVCEELVVCKSVFDALTFWSAGYRNVTCCYGLTPVPSDLLQTIFESTVGRVLIAFPNSDEGRHFSDLVAKLLIEKGIDCYRIDLPKESDVNDVAIKHGPEYLGDLIRKASWAGKGKKYIRDNQQDSQELKQAGTENESLSVLQSTLSDNIGEPTSTIVDQGPDEPSTPLKENHPATETLLPATVLPPLAENIDAEINGQEIYITLRDCHYRIKGLGRNTNTECLSINLLVRSSDGLFVDTLDLYSAKQRTQFIQQAKNELGVEEGLLKQDLGRILLKLDILQAEFLRQPESGKSINIELSNKERTEALALLRSPRLLERILNDFEQCGVVGERTNKLVGYLAALSRKLDKPLAIIIQSTSAAGKTALMDAVLSFVPEEDRYQYSALTSRSLFYMGHLNLAHKILAISEEEGASNATLALKLLQSEGELTIAATGKDHRGKLATQEHKVEGPIMLFSTTTAVDVNEELLNRCIILTVDEDRQQTQAIQAWQRFEETLEGLLASQHRQDILHVHQNAQRLIKPLRVVNPYATQLTFLSDKTRTRRDHQKYLTLIRSITLLHQYQREIKTTYYFGEEIEYIEVTLDDIAMANQLAHEVLGRSLDQVPHQTRRLLLLIEAMVSDHCASTDLSRAEYRFTRRDIREYSQWGETQLKVHLRRLEAMEYLLIHQGGRGKQIVYELLYNREGQNNWTKFEDTHLFTQSNLLFTKRFSTS